MSAPYILVVDDEPDIRNLVKEILDDEGYEVGVAEGGETARIARRERRPDLVLLDIWMPDVDGITLLKEWSEGGLPFPVIIMSGHGSVETAVEATRLGAYDFVEKPLSLAKLLLTVSRALEADRLERENVGLRQQTRVPAEPVGRSAPIQELREHVRRIARHETSVLISGEPGSGKKTFARYLHAGSVRREGPFIESSFSSMAQRDAVVELFGTEDDGSVHYGRLEQANGSTLYLEEVMEMDLQTQARLLHALESGSFLRVGGAQSVGIDVRIVAGTSIDLEGEVRLGRFREDLYYHLNVVPLHVPPLRDHFQDVPDLLAYYVDVFVEQEKLPYRRFSVAAQNRLRNHGWPGNVRELKNLVQRLLILSRDEVIDVEEVEAALGVPAWQGQPAGGRIPSGLTFELPLREARERFERAYLEHQLQQANGSIGQLAKRVGMERTHLYRKLRALGIDPKQLK